MERQSNNVAWLRSAGRVSSARAKACRVLAIQRDGPRPQTLNLRGWGGGDGRDRGGDPQRLLRREMRPTPSLRKASSTRSPRSRPDRFPAYTVRGPAADGDVARSPKGPIGSGRATAAPSGSAPWSRTTPRRPGPPRCRSTALSRRSSRAASRGTRRPRSCRCGRSRRARRRYGPGCPSPWSRVPQGFLQALDHDRNHIRAKDKTGLLTQSRLVTLLLPKTTSC
jgi:hypothetical protein